MGRQRKIVEQDDVFQMLQLQGSQVTGLSGAVNLRGELTQSFQVVVGLVTARHDQHAATHFVQGVFEFTAFVGGVDVDQHSTDTGRGELGEQPFQTVR